MLFRSRTARCLKFFSTSIEALVIGLSLSFSDSRREAGELLHALVGDIVVFQAQGHELCQTGEVLQAGVANAGMPEIEEFQFGEVVQIGQTGVVDAGFAQLPTASAHGPP